MNLEFIKVEYWKHKVETSALYEALVRLAKRIQVSKSEDVSLYDALSHYDKYLRKNDLLTESKAVAYNFTLAIFPAIIFLFTLVPYFPTDWVTTDSIMLVFKEIMPASMYDVTSSTIEDIISKPRGGLLSFGFLMALGLATNGMYGLIDSFNKCYKSTDDRGVLTKRLIAILLTVLLVFVLICAIFFLIFGQNILDFIFDHLGFLTAVDWIIFRLMQFTVFSIIFLLGISLIYYFAPAVHKRWRFISIGSVSAAIMCMLLSSGFSFYINNFASYNKLYGSIGTLIGVMIWLQLMSYILLIGFEVNASIDSAKHGLNGENDTVT